MLERAHLRAEVAVREANVAKISTVYVAREERCRMMMRLTCFRLHSVATACSNYRGLLECRVSVVSRCARKPIHEGKFRVDGVHAVFTSPSRDLNLRSLIVNL